MSNQSTSTYSFSLIHSMDRGGVVTITTGYRLDCPEFESRWWRDSPHQFRTTLGPPSLQSSGYRSSSPRVKRPGPGAYHPPPSSAEVNGRVELYLYSRFGSSWPILGWTLPSPLTNIFQLSFFLSASLCLS